MSNAGFAPTMVYDWEDKQTTCYNMYVVEKKNLDEVMKFFKDEVGFVPRYAASITSPRVKPLRRWQRETNQGSKRAFQTQFRRWGFPSKQNPSYKNEALVARTRELWQTNTSQKEMIGILSAEGFVVTERELMRLRSKHRLLLRGTNVLKSADGDGNQTTPVLDGAAESAHSHFIHRPSNDGEPLDDAEVLDLNDGHSSKRKERLDELQQESNSRWEAKKRRRRTRGWGGLPADPPGAPRFPSETTLESSKSCLRLDMSSYTEIRATFQAICQEHAIVKKTSAGPERWQAAKTQLIQSSPHLVQAFQQSEQVQREQMRLSLDVICMDVTKRMRIMEHQMTLAEAKNTLKVNPEEGRRLRQALIDLLTAHNFVNKHESTNWDELKELWMVQSGLDRRIPPIGGEGRERCLRAVQIVCRDIMKRWRDAQVALAKGRPQARATQDQAPTSLPSPQHAEFVELGDDEPRSNRTGLGDDFDFQIDPSLLAAGEDSRGICSTEFG